MSIAIPQLTTMSVELNEGVAEIRLQRPERSNALNEAMWQELRSAFNWVDATPQVRVAILGGAGRNFCAGIDLAMLAGVAQAVAQTDPARSREALRRLILDLQDCLSSVERCRKPVLAAIQGACIGGAVDLVTCCDMRYVAADA
ncbi:MAG: enoyl-CoA hydratase/isomerase family protein, partial [Candidatus Accumulibacter sp.]|uniref:enoyl-CoA hydratase-related protein n=1 Tax=Accumulibacter sp. TaxID=2053492 RepID=UPI001A5B09ED